MSNQKRFSFFNTCVKAFQSITGDSRELCVCPLCGLGYPRQALQDRTRTVEHVPPKSLEGKELLLTCKKCNNTAGHSVDAALHMRQQHKQFLQAVVNKSGNYQGRVKLTMGGEKLNFDLIVENSDTGKMELRPAGNCPKSVKRWRSQMERYVEEKTWDGQQFNVSTIHGFHQWLSKVGDLRIGYLVAFAAFGYRYAFDKRLNPIRDQLKNPHHQKLDHFWSFSGWGAPSNKVLAIAHEPVELVFVGLGNSIILLPWLDGPSNPYKELSSRSSNGGSINFRGKEVSWPDRLRLELDFIKRKAI